MKIPNKNSKYNEPKIGKKTTKFQIQLKMSRVEVSTKYKIGRDEKREVGRGAAEK